MVGKRIDPVDDTAGVEEEEGEGGAPEPNAPEGVGVVGVLWIIGEEGTEGAGEGGAGDDVTGRVGLSFFGLNNNEC